MKDLWASRSLPILEAIGTANQHGESPALLEVADDAGLDVETAGRELKTLIDDGYVLGTDVGNLSIRHNWQNLELTGDGRRAVGQWPNPEALTEQFLAMLEQQAENAKTATDRENADRAVTALSDISKGVLTSIIAQLFRQATGM